MPAYPEKPATSRYNPHASAVSGSRLRFHGKPAGIQKRYEGISGIDLGNKIVKAVADLEAKRVATVTHPLYPNALDTLPCIIGSFSAGNYPSAFPVNCLLKGSIGTVPGEDHEGVKRSLVEQVTRAQRRIPG